MSCISCFPSSYSLPVCSFCRVLEFVFTFISRRRRRTPVLLPLLLAGPWRAPSSQVQRGQAGPGGELMMSGRLARAGRQRVCVCVACLPPTASECKHAHSLMHSRTHSLCMRAHIHTRAHSHKFTVLHIFTHTHIYKHENTCVLYVCISFNASSPCSLALCPLYSLIPFLFNL